MSKSPSNPKPPGAAKLGKVFSQVLARSKAELVPPAFMVLWQVIRFVVLYGGRASAKSWSIARVLLVMAAERKLRILCCREIQGSIKESAYRLLADQITLLGLDDQFDVQSDSITHRTTGSRFFFEGLRYNASKIRSYESVDIVWCEEAQSISDLSWETLLPTIRKKGSRFFISFNPMTKADPVLLRFVDSGRRDVLAKKVSWRDNPHLSAEANAEREWLEKVDPDAYKHVWEGFPREASDALILKGKYVVENFDVKAEWAGPYHGLDLGFARDPSTGVQLFVDDDERVLYVKREGWWLGADIDKLPALLEDAIPGVSRHTLYCDSARPETISYLQRHGIPAARAAEKWPNSVEDGLSYLRSFARIVIDPSCKHFIDECGSYSFKCDRLTGVPLPEPEDKNNHGIDAARYALSPLIRSLPSGGFFQRGALLTHGEGLEPGVLKPRKVFAVLVMSEESAGAAVVYCALNPVLPGPALIVLGYEIAEVHEALSPDGEWAIGVYMRLQQLRQEWGAAEALATVFIEDPTVRRAFEIVAEPVLTRTAALCVAGASGAALHDLNTPEAAWFMSSDNKPLPTLDERCAELRSVVNAGGLVKLSRAAYAQQATYRSSTTNHFSAQVLGYRPKAKADVAQELVAAFAAASLIARYHDQRAAVANADAAIARRGELQDVPELALLPPPPPVRVNESLRRALHRRAGHTLPPGISVDAPEYVPPALASEEES